MNTHTQGVDRNMMSYVTIQNTEMNLIENVSQTQMDITQVKSARCNDKKKGSDKKNADLNNGNQKVCKICLEEEDFVNLENELIAPCKCAGSMQYIHTECLREWLNGKKLIYNGEKVKSFFWKALECELCKTPYENKMKNKLF